MTDLLLDHVTHTLYNLTTSSKFSYKKRYIILIYTLWVRYYFFLK